MDELGRLQRIKTLKRRLGVGHERIEAARRNHQDVAAWEKFWIEMLRSYEELCAELGDDDARVRRTDH